MAKNIDLVSLREDYTVTFPNDKTFVIVPFRGPEQVMLLEYNDPETPSERRAELLQALLRAAVPSATDADWASMAFQDWAHVIAAANGNAEIVELARKNG